MNLQLSIIIFGVFLAIVGVSARASASTYSFNYDEQCGDKLFNDYLKDSEPEFDKYMDKANNLYDSLNPHSESEINDYIDELNPLADDYIDNLEPYAQDYVDKLESCIN